jgi:hypothetical protein
MTAPTEWTYGGLVDWTSENSLKLTPYEYVLRPIIEAIKEKAGAAKPYYGSFWDDIGTMYKSLLIESSNPLEFKAFNPLETFAGYAEDIHHIISKLIPEFVNHTDTSGDWSRNANFPMWDEESILNSIGATERIASDSFGNFDYNAVKLNPYTIREWVYQNYLILNKLKWVKRLFSVDYWKQSYKWRGGGGDSWDEAESNFLAYPGWYVVTDYGEQPNAPGIYSSAGISHGSTHYYDFNRRVTSVGVKNLPELHKSIDYYMYIEKATSALSYDSEVFDGQGDGFTEDKWNKVSEVSETSDSEIIFPWFTNETPALPPNRPLPFVLKGYSAGAWNGNALLLKFDGENGFKFKNW